MPITLDKDAIIAIKEDVATLKSLLHKVCFISNSSVALEDNLNLLTHKRDILLGASETVSHELLGEVTIPTSELIPFCEQELLTSQTKLTQSGKVIQQAILELRGLLDEKV